MLTGFVHLHYALYEVTLALAIDRTAEHKLKQMTELAVDLFAHCVIVRFDCSLLLLIYLNEIKF